MISFNQAKQITIKIDYHNEQDALRFLREFRKDFFQVHEIKNHFEGIFVEVTNSQFFELSFQNPDPRKETINGKECLIYPSRMNSEP